MSGDSARYLRELKRKPKAFINAVDKKRSDGDLMDSDEEDSCWSCFVSSLHHGTTSCWNGHSGGSWMFSQEKLWKNTSGIVGCLCIYEFHGKKLSKNVRFYSIFIAWQLRTKRLRPPKSPPLSRPRPLGVPLTCRRWTTSRVPHCRRDTCEASCDACNKGCDPINPAEWRS